MVREANEKRAKAEKLLAEANGKMDVLQGEVEALKVLVLHSAPSALPARHRPLPSVSGSRSGGSSPRKPQNLPSSSTNPSPSGKPLARLAYLERTLLFYNQL